MRPPQRPALAARARAARARGDRARLRAVPGHDTVVDLEDVWRVFGSDAPVVALQAVDLTLAPGSSLAVVGSSGSGKSTLMNILGLLDRPTSGVYRFQGTDVGRLSDDARASLRAHRIGFVFQNFNLLGHRTALENVMLAEVYRGGAREGRAERAQEALRRVDMSARASFFPPKLSGGEQQRVAIARALMGDHTLLLCDEPTGNLDSANTQSVLAVFDRLGELGLTVVIVTHEEEVAAHARRRVRMVDGRAIEEESAA